MLFGQKGQQPSFFPSNCPKIRNNLSIFPSGEPEKPGNTARKAVVFPSVIFAKCYNLLLTFASNLTIIYIREAHAFSKGGT